MKLTQLENLLALQKYGSFSAAAENLYISQPAISNSIKDLEAELGCVLLTRSNKGITFTKAGTEILTQARFIIDAKKRIFSIAANHAGKELDVRLGAPHHLCNMVLLDLLITETSSGQILLSSNDSKALIEQLLSGNLDIAVVQFSGLSTTIMQRAQQENITFKPLFTDKLYFCCRPTHPLAEKPRITPKDLLDYPLVSFHGIVEDVVQRMYAEYHAAPQIINFDEVLSIRKYVCSTDALIVQPTVVLTNGNRNFSEQMVPLTVEGLDWDDTVCAAYKASTQNDHLDRTIQTLSDYAWSFIL